MLTGDGRTLTYTANNLLATAVKSNQEVEYYYGPDNQRFKRVDRDPSDNETTTFYSSSTEWIVHENNTKEWKRSILGYAQITHEFNSSNSETSQSLHYLLKDHLGSITHIVDDATYGTLVASQEFDPWGNRRKAEDWTQVLPTLNIQSWFREAGPITGRGYTGHESMDEMGLIHMNGRVYDPKLGRMIQADPLIQAPYFSQSLNRYSYVWNNPMRFTDPSGYCATEPPEQSPPKEEEPEKEEPQDSGFMEEQIVYGTRPPEFDYSYLFWTDSDTSGSTGGNPNVMGQQNGNGSQPSENNEKLLRDKLNNEFKQAIKEAYALGKWNDYETFIKNVVEGGKWDFKNRTDYIGLTDREEFGNFAFGALAAAWADGASFGFSNLFPDITINIMQRGAGYYQEYYQSGNYQESDGSFYYMGNSNYGDNGNDKALINQGARYYMRRK